MTHTKFVLHPEDTRQEKFRNELKYLCSEGELIQLQARIQMLCDPDPHAGPEGIYNIRSVYFDDQKNRYFLENENGIDPKKLNAMKVKILRAEQMNLRTHEKTAEAMADYIRKIIVHEAKKSF